MLVYNVKLKLFNFVFMDNKTVLYFPSSSVETVVKMVFGLLRPEKQKPKVAKLRDIFVVEDYNQDRSVFDIQHELGQIQLEKSISEPAMVAENPQTRQDSSPDTPQPPPYNHKVSWMLGCLRPVWSLIGRTAVNEIKDNEDDWVIPFENIKFLEYLGCGGQGIVYKGTLNNELVALKKVNSLKETDIKNLRKLNHPNILKFKGICTEENFYSIIMEFCPYGSLYELLKNQKNKVPNLVTAPRVAAWSEQIACGMNYLHMNRIIHRDLKSGNVLIGKNEVIKISDFGTHRTWSGVSEPMSFVGTVSWMAPEVIKGAPCSEKVDIWAFGVVLWELITCEAPYDGMEPGAIMYLVGSGKLKPPLPKTCPDGYKLIMEMCWKMDPKMRPSFKLIRSHLEIASVEILANFKGDELSKTQKNWKEEIQLQIIHIKENVQKYRMELVLKEEQAMKKRDLELKHIRDISEHYNRKLEKVEQLYLELSGALQQLEQYRKEGSRKRDFHCSNKRRMLYKVMKKIDRKKPNNCSTTPTSPERSMTSTTSPDSPPVAIPKAPLYVKLNPLSRNPEVLTQTTQTSDKPHRKHHRTNSGSPRSSCSRTLSRRSLYVNAETQTESMEISETDLSPTISHSSTITASSRQPQNVILVQNIADGSDEEGQNGNSVQLHYFPKNSSSVPLNTSPTFLKEDSLNRNNVSSTKDSDEDNLDVIGRKVLAIKNGNIFTDIRLSSENGNIESREIIDSAEDAANDDSFTDEEGEIYNHTLRRRSSKPGKEVLPSLARRPIYPRRSSRYKNNFTSDEGNTSEYSVSPSSKNSTLESNPERPRMKPDIQIKRPTEESDGSSESDLEENTTIKSQVAYNNNVIETER